MKIEKCGNITLINGDCMEFMQSQSDKSFDLTIIEKDLVYYEQAKKRLIEFQRQQVLF